MNRTEIAAFEDSRDSLRPGGALAKTTALDQQLKTTGGFDALVAAVLLAGLSEVIASPELRERALHRYAEIQAPLRRLALMDGIYLELFPLIDSRCKHWVYLSSNQRMDAVIFS